jgi:hypothetical protein
LGKVDILRKRTENRKKKKNRKDSMEGLGISRDSPGT